MSTNPELPENAARPAARPKDDDADGMLFSPFVMVVAGLVLLATLAYCAFHLIRSLR